MMFRGRKRDVNVLYSFPFLFVPGSVLKKSQTPGDFRELVSFLSISPSPLQFPLFSFFLFSPGPLAIFHFVNSTSPEIITAAPLILFIAWMLCPLRDFSELSVREHWRGDGEDSPRAGTHDAPTAAYGVDMEWMVEVKTSEWIFGFFSFFFGVVLEWFSSMLAPRQGGR